MDNENSYDSDDSLTQLRKEVSRVFVPQDEEIKKELTKEELIALCLNIECVVDMTRWNPTYDHYKYLKRKGKFDNKPKEYILKTLTKAANKYKNDPKHIYTKERIEKERYEEWKEVKALNVRWLTYVWSQREDCSSSISSSNDSVVTVKSSQESVMLVEETEKSVVDVNQNVPEYMKEMHKNIIDAGAVLLDRTNQNSDSDISTHQSSEESQGELRRNSLECLQDELIHILETESDGVTSEYLHRTNTSQIVSSQEPDNYNTFNSNIPLTSTQSQH